MSEEQKAELLREINTLINGRACQTKLGEAILSITRRVNTLTEIAIVEAGKGNFTESDAIINEITGWSSKLWETQGRSEVFPGHNAKY